MLKDFGIMLGIFFMFCGLAAIACVIVSGISDKKIAEIREQEEQKKIECQYNDNYGCYGQRCTVCELQFSCDTRCSARSCNECGGLKFIKQL